MYWKVQRQNLYESIVTFLSVKAIRHVKQMNSRCVRESESVHLKDSHREGACVTFGIAAKGSVHFSTASVGSCCGSESEC